MILTVIVVSAIKHCRVTSASEDMIKLSILHSSQQRELVEYSQMWMIKTIAVISANATILTLQVIVSTCGLHMKRHWNLCKREKPLLRHFLILMIPISIAVCARSLWKHEKAIVNTATKFTKWISVVAKLQRLLMKTSISITPSTIENNVNVFISIGTNLHITWKNFIVSKSLESLLNV